MPVNGASITVWSGSKLIKSGYVKHITEKGKNSYEITVDDQIFSVELKM